MTIWNARTLKIGVLRRYSSFVGVYLSRNPPVIVYQMGKVASSAVRNALLLHGLHAVLHLHAFFPLRNRNAHEIEVDEGIRKSLIAEILHAQRVFDRASLARKIHLLYREKVHNERIYKLCVQGKRKAKFISLVRDPIAANLSMFFQLFEEYAGTPYLPGRFSTREIIDIFLEKYNHSRPLTWFDAEMKTSLEIDVYKWPFPKDRGYLSVSKGDIDLLLLQSELEDSAKEVAISEFVGLEGFRMIQSNLGREKNYGDEYRLMKTRIRFPNPLLDEIYGSKYARHFYTEDALEKFRAQWDKRDEGTLLR